MQEDFEIKSLCHCLWDWFFLKTAPRMQEDLWNYSHCVTVYEIDFFLKLRPECKKTLKLSHCVTVYEIDFFLKLRPECKKTLKL